MYDIIVVGGGPAGLTAALYGLRNGKTVLLIEKGTFGGQITFSPRVENIPGFTVLSGNEFADHFMDQVMVQGVEMELDEVTEVIDEGDKKIVKTTYGNAFEGKTVILATGVKHRMLGLEGEEKLVGEGISFCAVCDGDFYKDKKVCVAGGGNSALQEAILLADKCSEVVMLQDMPVFTGEQKLQDTLFSKSNVTAHVETKINELKTNADGKLIGLEIESRKTGEKEIVSCDGLFVAIGLIPENDPYKNLADLNSYGYFDSDESCSTKTPGIFVAGDCRSKRIRQVTTACADGAVAALAACNYINNL